MTEREAYSYCPKCENRISSKDRGWLQHCFDFVARRPTCKKCDSQMISSDELPEGYLLVREDIYLPENHLD